MNLSALLNSLRQSSEYQALLARLNPTMRPSDHATIGLNVLNAARPYLLAALQQDCPRAILAIAPKPEQALQLHRQLSAWSGAPDDVLYFPESENLPYERANT